MNSPVIAFRPIGIHQPDSSEDAEAPAAGSSAYFLERELAERRAADGASSPAARLIHERLAQSYAAMARDLCEKEVA